MAVILVVDDDPAMRDVLKEAIVDFGHQAQLAESGAAALSALEKYAIDAALIDLRMPGMDGLELLAHIRQRPEPPPVAVLTAHATTPSRPYAWAPSIISPNPSAARSYPACSPPCSPPVPSGDRRP